MGLGLVAVGVGCLEFVLDKGQEKDWFGDPMITDIRHLRGLHAGLFVWWEWRHPDPIVDLKLLKNRNFGTAVFLQFVLGMVLFGSTVLIPQFLQLLMGYTAERAGMVLSPGALVLMVAMPIAGRLVGKMDARLLASIGYFMTAAGLYNLTRLDLDVSFGTIVLWRSMQVMGLPFIFIPISTLNYIGVPRDKNNQIRAFRTSHATWADQWARRSLRRFCSEHSRYTRQCWERMLFRAQRIPGSSTQPKVR